MLKKRSSSQWLNPYISLFVPWLVTLRKGSDRKLYQTIIRGLLPETLNQRKIDTDAVNFLLLRWDRSDSKSDLKTVSELLNSGIKLVDRGWLIGLGSGAVLIFAGFIAINISNSVPITIDAPQTLSSPGNPLSPSPDNTGILVLPGVNVSDMDSPNFNTGQLTVSFTANGTPDDRLSIRDRGKNPGEIGVDGNNITYGGIAIGNFQGGDGTAPLTVTFNDKSTPEAAQALMRSILYKNISNSPNVGSRTVQFQLNDGGENGTSKAIAQIINVIAENQDPVLTVPNNKIVKENANLIISGISISDSDSQNITMTLGVTNGILTVKTDVAQGLTANDIIGNQTKTVTLKGTVSQIKTTLANTAAVTYLGNQDFSGNDSLTVTANDGGKTTAGIPKKSLVWPPDALKNKTDKKSLNITVTPLNAPPVVTVPDRTTTKENTNLTIGGISISDPDTQNLTVTMNVTNGILTVPANVVQGLTASNISGNKTKTVTFKGTIAQINATLADAAAVIYRGNKDFSGNDSLNITVNDGGKKPESKTINITVNALNKPPQLTVTNVVTVGQNTITQTEAVNLINTYLQAKARIFAPPFDRQLADSLLTGKAYEDRISSPEGGSVNYLQRNNAYYQYGLRQAKSLEKFSVDGELVQIDVHIYEELTYYELGKPPSPQTNQKNYRVILQQKNGTWKIAELKPQNADGE